MDLSTHIYIGFGAFLMSFMYIMRINIKYFEILLALSETQDYHDYIDKVWDKFENSYRSYIFIAR